MNPSKTKVTRATRHLALALLASFVLVSCGGGGGGGQSSSSTSTNSTTAVINKSGGAIALADGTSVTFAAGIVKDGTTVTISTLPPEASTSTEISSLSSLIRVEFPIDALMASGSLPDDGITFSIPISGVATGVSVKYIAGTIGQSYRYVQATLSAGTASVILYGKVGIAATSIAAKIAQAQIVSFRNSAVASAQNALAKNYVVVAVVKQFSPFVPTAGQLLKIQKNGSSGILSTFSTDYSFVDSSADKLLPNSGLPLGKIPLVLVHGIQATPGAACDGGAEAYKTTWEQFIIFFFSSQGQALQDKYQLYTFSYQTDLHIEGNGLLLASILKDTFGNVPTVIVAHSMGGLVTRSAIVQHATVGAQIGGVITLGTPHHGSKVVNKAAAIVDSFSCFFADGSPGADDLKWDNFDDSSKTCDNNFLCGPAGINTLDTASNYTKYIPYAGVWDPSSPICAAYLIGGLPALIFDATTYGMCWGASQINLTSDGMVPEVSARFTDSIGGQYLDKLQWSGKPRTYQGINHATIINDPKVYEQYPDGSAGGLVQDLLGFYVSLLPPAAPTVSTGIANGATAISVNSAISSTFSQPIDASTLNTSTFTLSGPSGLVAGTATYNTTTNTATYTPSAPLAYNTTYTATITTGVKDLAGNTLPVDYSWSFSTTGAAPAAPTGITAVQGNGQATMSWNVAAGVTYNLYMASVSGVTKSNYSSLTDGMQHVGVTSPYTHTGLINGKPYYFVVMAVNASGESGESVEVVVTPRSILNDRVLMLTQRDGNWEIYSVGLDGLYPSNLTNNPASDTLPSLSPERGRIAFVSDRNGNNEIYVMTSDGANPTRLTSSSADDVFPAWSPDGKKIAFVSKRDGNYEIYVMDADGGNQLRLTITSADESFPSWSPDSKRIAFVSKRDGNEEIYVMNADGTGTAVNLTNNTASDNIPFFSPDGAWISFVSNRDGGYDLWVMDTNGSNLRKITTATNNIVGWYAWSPDGSQIAFDSKADGDYEVYAINFDGTNLRQLTTNTVADQFASWTWDGKKIVFISNRDGKNQIFAMDPDGGNPINVSNDTSSVALPMASPIYKTGGGCFIATAAYGSYLEPEVMVLRGFRDKYLLTNDVGKTFVTYYYKWSPPIADIIKRHESLRLIVRIGLTPLVYGVKYPEGTSAMLVLMMLSFAFRRARKKGNNRGQTTFSHG